MASRFGWPCSISLLLANSEQLEAFQQQAVAKAHAAHVQELQPQAIAGLAQEWSAQANRRFDGQDAEECCRGVKERACPGQGGDGIPQEKGAEQDDQQYREPAPGVAGPALKARAGATKVALKPCALGWGQQSQGRRRRQMV